MTYLEARTKAEAILHEEFKNENFKIAIDEEFSFEFSRGWVFRYNTVEFIENQDTDNSLMVTNPVIIDRIDGTVSRLIDKKRTFKKAEELIEDYVKSKEGVTDSRPTSIIGPSVFLENRNASYQEEE